MFKHIILDGGYQIIATNENNRYIGEILIFLCANTWYLHQKLIKRIENLKDVDEFSRLAHDCVRICEELGVVITVRYNFDKL